MRVMIHYISNPCCYFTMKIINCINHLQEIFILYTNPTIHEKNP